jgi:hypothetical protein
VAFGCGTVSIINRVQNRSPIGVQVLTSLVDSRPRCASPTRRMQSREHPGPRCVALCARVDWSFGTDQRKADLMTARRIKSPSGDTGEHGARHAEINCRMDGGVLRPSDAALRAVATVEVITSVERWRRWGREEKLRIVAESAQPTCAAYCRAIFGI